MDYILQQIVSYQIPRRLNLPPADTVWSRSLPYRLDFDFWMLEYWLQMAATYSSLLMKHKPIRFSEDPNIESRHQLLPRHFWSDEAES